MHCQWLPVSISTLLCLGDPHAYFSTATPLFVMTVVLLLTIWFLGWKKAYCVLSSLLLTIWTLLFHTHISRTTRPFLHEDLLSANSQWILPYEFEEAALVLYITLNIIGINFWLYTYHIQACINSYRFYAIKHSSVNFPKPFPFHSLFFKAKTLTNH